ncbi:hypothetical protein [Rhodoplanes roseus]|uniref:Transcriptional regulator n=1 Tax=Rhodoplanes roseus TaxID=29409 RepID=A0A327L1R3_9BRAD|nr:hypothetical protein [Rhodoplanes roseus]RAI45020.1 hypothetical protein CH341_05955 [Rhodoplanes roseus]
MTRTETSPAAYLTLQFLGWLAEHPRSYAEVMEAWRTSCPRLSIWEDALIDGLVEIGPGAPSRDTAPVRLTPRGRVMMAAGERPCAFEGGVNQR